MSKPPPMGHNGGFTFDSRADIPRDVPRVYFFRCSIQDVLDDILRMPKDERGVYMTALLVMYKEMEGLPADDKRAAMSLGLDVREWRHIKPKLIARGVLYERPSGRISNRRFEAEISAYVTEFKNRQEAALERERRKKEGAVEAAGSPRHRRDIAGTSPRHRADISAMSPTSRTETDEDFSKNINKNNGSTTTIGPQDTHAVSVRARDLITMSYELVKKEEKEVQTSIHADSFVSAGASAFSDEDSVDPKVGGAIRRLKTLIADEDEAHRIVESRLREFAPEDWRDGIDDLTRNRRTGVERRQIGEDVVLAYVRRAEQNRCRASTPETVDKPPPKTIEPGVVAEGIAITPERKIQLSNGVRQEWLDNFGGDERLLDLTLTAAVGQIKVNSPTALASQITSILAQACKDVIIRRQNTIVAVDRQAERRPPRAPAAGVDAKTETRAERLARMAAEIESKGSRT